MAKHGYSDLHDSIMGFGDALVQQQQQRQQQQQAIQMYLFKQQMEQKFQQQQFEQNVRNYQQYAPMFNNPGGQPGGQGPGQPQQPQANPFPQGTPQPAMSMANGGLGTAQGQPLDLGAALARMQQGGQTGQTGQMQLSAGQMPQSQQQGGQNPFVLNPAAMMNSGKISMMKNPNYDQQPTQHQQNQLNFANSKQQDALEKQYSDRIDRVLSNRTGGLGQQDQKVNQAIHLRTLLDQYYDPQTGAYNVPQSQYEEIAIGLANLVSGSNVATESMRQGVMQRTAKGDISGAISYVTGTPQTSNTQDVFKNLADSIDRQGSLSEKIRNNYLVNLRNQFPSRLNKEAQSRIEKTSQLNSYQDVLSNSPAFQNGTDRSSQDVNPMPGQGSQGTKTLDKNTATRFLHQAGGDKNKARTLAKQQGFNF